MSDRTDYSPGVPCWVETLQPEPKAAARFYGELFGWEFDQPVTMPGGLGGLYLAGRLRGRLVAGVGRAPVSTTSAVWAMYVRVDTIEAALSRVADANGEAIIGPLDAHPAGRLALVRDSTGVALGLWEAGRRTGAELVNETGSWWMAALHTSNIERARSFYATVFGWQLDLDAPVGLFRLAGHVGGEDGSPVPRDVVAVAAPSEPEGAPPPHWAVSFRVADVGTIAERAVALGGHLLLPPTDGPGLSSAVVADPQQGVFAISAARSPSGGAP